MINTIKNHAFIVALFYLFITGCTKPDFEPITVIFNAGEKRFGSATALKNGLPFEGSARGNIFKCNNGEIVAQLLVGTYDDAGASRESFNLVAVRFMVEDTTYFLPMSVCGKTTTDGLYTNGFEDEEIDIYNLSNNFNNWVRVIKCDTVDNELIGEFNLQYVLDKSKPRNYPSSVDVITFTNGQFDMKFFE